MTSSEWGRVEDDGTVYLKTADGERVVGQYAAGTPEEALAFYTERFAALAFDVDLLEKRVAAGKLSPEEASESVKATRAQVGDAAVVGDLASLGARLDALGPVIALQRENRRAEKAAKTAEAKEAKDQLVAAAEKLAEGSDWRHGSNRMRDLLEEWKAIARLDKATDDEYWKRFSTARSAYSKRRKAHFAEQDEKRDGSRVVKERLAKEAEALATSTDWGATAGRYRDLMRDWKAAGPAPRDVEDTLWARFRGAQDAFFGARDAANAALDAEFAGNAEVKDALLVEAEALLPIKDLAATKKKFRDIGERWEAAGKVPRDRIRDLDARIRKVEVAIRDADEATWRRTDPEKTARASGMVTQFSSAVTKTEGELERARAAGDDRKVKDLEKTLASQRSLLEMAERASADYTG